jgi:hypothetical protein
VDDAVEVDQRDRSEPDDGAPKLQPRRVAWVKATQIGSAGELDFAKIAVLKSDLVIAAGYE